jgi:NAD(P)-dependent dehydrogenase (short-subunit alcohol dehydrogenase family)
MTKTWLITGSSRGFGRDLARAALAGGDRVLATARRPEQLDDLVGQVRRPGARCPTGRHRSGGRRRGRPAGRRCIAVA